MNAVKIARDRQEGCCDTVPRRSGVTKKNVPAASRNTRKKRILASAKRRHAQFVPAMLQMFGIVPTVADFPGSCGFPGPFSKKEVLSFIWGRQNEANITKLYSLRNVPVHLLDQVGSYTHR
jgi:hypothetical protein